MLVGIIIFLTEEPDEAKEPEATPTPSKKAKMDADPPPGGPVEIVFSFDTTGSMYPCLTQVSVSG